MVLLCLTSVLVLCAATLPGATADSNVSDLDPRAGTCASVLDGASTLIVDPDNDFPRQWEYWEHCDGTFENGFCWHYPWHQDPYYSAVAEGFSGPAQVRGMRVYLTQVGCFADETMDLSVWGGGPQGPGCVLSMIPEASVLNVPFWPEVGVNDYEIDASVGPRFYVGANGVWPHHDYLCPWYHAFDIAGPPGDPWTCCHPGMGGQIPRAGSPLARPLLIFCAIALRGDSVSMSREPPAWKSGSNPGAPQSTPPGDGSSSSAVRRAPALPGRDSLYGDAHPRISGQQS